MRKLLLTLSAFLLLIPASAPGQGACEDFARQLKGCVIEGVEEAVANTLARRDETGKIGLDSLPTASGPLEWFLDGDALAVSAHSVVLKSLPNLQAGKITSLSCAACVSVSDCTTAASATINLDPRALSALHTAGTDLHTSEFTCNQDGFSTSTFAGDDTNAANEVWNLSVSAVTSATVLRVWATVELQ